VAETGSNCEFSRVTSWETFSGTTTDWDSLVASLANSSIYHSSKWAKIQEQRGWDVVYLRTDDSTSAAMVLMRRYGRLFCVSWLPGGVAGRTDAVNQQLADTIRKLRQAWIHYIRIAFPSDHRRGIAYEEPWVPSKRRVGASRSVVLDLTLSSDQLLAAAGPNWRRNLKRARKTSVVVRPLGVEDAAAVDQLQQVMVRYKGIQPRLAVSGGELLLSLGESMIAIGVLEDGELLSVRAVGAFGSVARDLIAATSPSGRQIYSSYLATWTLVERLKEVGVTTYDLGGIDEEDNLGVANFKLGTGGKVIRYPDELEMSHPRTARHLVAPIIAARSRRI